MAQKQNAQILWKDSDTLQDILTTELVVSGVYLKLFITNPGWTLRKPKTFLSDLLDFVADNITRSGSEVCHSSKHLPLDRITSCMFYIAAKGRPGHFNDGSSISTKRAT